MNVHPRSGKFYQKKYKDRSLSHPAHFVTKPPTCSISSDQACRWSSVFQDMTHHLTARFLKPFIYSLTARLSFCSISFYRNEDSDSKPRGKTVSFLDRVTRYKATGLGHHLIALQTASSHLQLYAIPPKYTAFA
ncbi:hypothetical protein AVEN_259192-1 [Araneus ventricosus]|uniref:Uncharacterized protein n=1 Tax=Araneus ventricosus TaxID=182803 RepID=A0A4Y2IGX7_ARAVE|nr:hypothetical protein AVEN_259192-1 [Araneus ventricosus]